jgi:3' exoribonuclease, RNase T-like
MIKAERDIMVDLETLATDPQAAILTVAAIRFNTNRDYSEITDPFSMDYFYARVDLDQPNRSINDDTLKWWSEQAVEVREEAFGEEDRFKIADVMTAFTEWARGGDRYWANGAAFDFPILEGAIKDAGQMMPWQFWQVCDARTIYKLVPDHDAPKASHHHALYDCLNQIIRLNDCLNRMGRYPK